MSLPIPCITFCPFTLALTNPLLFSNWRKGKQGTMSSHLAKHAKKLGYVTDLINPVALNDQRRIKHKSTTIYKILFEEDQAWVQLEQNRKLRLLLKHYGLADLKVNRSAQLAIRLAIDWVPGFGVVQEASRSKGAPSKITDQEDLVETIEALRKSSPAYTLIEACRKFKELNNTDPRWKSITPETIKNLYGSSKKALAARRSEFARTQLRRTIDGLSILGRRLLSAKPHKKS